MSLKFGCSVMFWALVWCSINWSHWDLEILVLEEENQPDNLWSLGYQEGHILAIVTLYYTADKQSLQTLNQSTSYCDL